MRLSRGSDRGGPFRIAAVAFVSLSLERKDRERRNIRYTRTLFPRELRINYATSRYHLHAAETFAVFSVAYFRRLKVSPFPKVCPRI